MEVNIAYLTFVGRATFLIGVTLVAAALFTFLQQVSLLRWWLIFLYARFQ